MTSVKTPASPRVGIDIEERDANLETFFVVGGVERGWRSAVVVCGDFQGVDGVNDGFGGRIDGASTSKIRMEYGRGWIGKGGWW
jgi:glycerate-2-kinase